MRIGFLLFLFSFYVQAKPLKVIVDPGHGGVDNGAVRNNIKESDIVLKVALKLKELLKEDPRFRVLMTRENNTSRSLKSRVRFAEANEGDLFISLHANTEITKKAQGVEFYFQNQMSPDEESQYFASLENHNVSVATEANQEVSKKSEINAILEDLKKQHSIRSSHRLSKKMAAIWEKVSSQSVNIRQAPFYVVSQSTMPSILIELGFISNSKEGEKLSTPEYQKEIAQRIYMGLLDFKEMIDNSRLAGL